MPFGKYRGRLLTEIPQSYLCWVLTNCENITWQLRMEIRAIVDKARQDARQDARGQAPDGSKPPELIDWSGILTTWYRAMSLRFHPDRGGTTEAMVAVNMGYEKLKELTGG
jgi:hypothetical protein